MLSRTVAALCLRTAASPAVGWAVRATIVATTRPPLPVVRPRIGGSVATAPAQ